MLSYNLKLLLSIGLISLLLTILLLSGGNVGATIAWWIMIICLLPSLFLIKESRYYSVKIFVWIVFITQMITLPLFYLFPESYEYQSHRPFGFTGAESIKVYGKLGIFLFIFVIMSLLLEKLFKIPAINSASDSKAGKQQESAIKERKLLSPGNNKISLICAVLIVLLVLVMVPLNNWMFKMGIGLTGVEPPKLPYRLSGLLTYLAKYIVPIIIALLYMRTRRNSLILLIMLALYSIFLGVSTVSKGAALMVIMAPWIFALLDRRWLLFVIATISVVMSVGIASASREIVYVVSLGVNTSDSSLGLLGTLYETAIGFKWSQFYLVLPAIAGRIDSFENFWLASQVSPGSLGGGWAIFLKLIDWRLIDLGHDAVHLEVLGYTVPEGYYNVAASFVDYMFWAVSDSAIFYVVLSLFVALFLIWQEYLIRKIALRYDILSIFIHPVIFLFTIQYYIAPGVPFRNYIFLFLIVFSRLPKIKLLIFLSRYLKLTNNYSRARI